MKSLGFSVVAASFSLRYSKIIRLKPEATKATSPKPYFVAAHIREYPFQTRESRGFGLLISFFGRGSESP
jgi:hypothetical protein